MEGLSIYTEVMINMKYIAAYLVSIVSANLLVNHFGPESSKYIAFAIVGFDLTLRDKLHKSWENKHLWFKMFILICTGSLLSYVVNQDSKQIALASCVAFLGAGFVDTIVFAYLSERSDKVRINGSNICSSVVDSILFPSIAFGMPLLYEVIVWQIVAKIGGGYVWGKILKLWK